MIFGNELDWEGELDRWSRLDAEPVDVGHLVVEVAREMQGGNGPAVFRELVHRMTLLRHEPDLAVVRQLADIICS